MERQATAQKGPQAQRAEPTDGQVVKGRVLDPLGRPIAGADVWLPVRTNAPKRTAHAKTNQNGRFTLRVPNSWIDPSRSKNLWTVWAYAEGWTIGTAPAREALEPGRTEAELNIELQPETDTSFLVVDPNGRPIAGATVRPLTFKTRSFFAKVPDALADLVGARSDEAGRARLPALAPDRLRSVEVIAGGYGTQRQQLETGPDAPAESTIQLRPVGRIEGRLIGAKREWVRGAQLSFRTSVSASEFSEPTEGVASVQTDERGRFVVPAIAEGQLLIDEKLSRELPVRAKLPAGPIRVRAGQTTRIEIPLVPGVIVRGQVRLRGSGKPVAGAWVLLQYGPYRQHDDATTDDNGRFQARVLPGPVRLFVMGVPESAKAIYWIVQWPQTVNVPEGVAEFLLPPIELPPAVRLTGRLVDQHGHPVGGAQVTVTVGGHGYWAGSTDEQGRFSLLVPAGQNVEGGRARLDREFYKVAVASRQPLTLRLEPAPYLRARTRRQGARSYRRAPSPQQRYSDNYVRRLLADPKDRRLSPRGLGSLGEKLAGRWRGENQIAAVEITFDGSLIAKCRLEDKVSRRRIAFDLFLSPYRRREDSVVALYARRPAGGSMRAYLAGLLKNGPGDALLLWLSPPHRTYPPVRDLVLHRVAERQRSDADEPAPSAKAKQ